MTHYYGDDYFTRRMREIDEIHDHNRKVIDRSALLSILGIIIFAILGGFVHHFLIFGVFLSLAPIAFGPSLFMKKYSETKETNPYDYN